MGNARIKSIVEEAYEAEDGFGGTAGADFCECSGWTGEIDNDDGVRGDGEAELIDECGLEGRSSGQAGDLGDNGTRWQWED